MLLFAATVDPLLLRDKSDHHFCDNCHLHDHPHNYNQIMTIMIIPDNCHHPEHPCKDVERPLAPVVNTTIWALFRPVLNVLQFHIFLLTRKILEKQINLMWQVLCATELNIGDSSNQDSEASQLK